MPVQEETVREYLEAKQFYRDGKLNEAETILRKLSGNIPAFYQGRFLLAKALFYQNKAAEAESVMRALLKEEPLYREAELLYIRLLINQNNLAGAEERTDKLLSYDTTDPRLLYLKALIAQNRENTSASLQYLRQAVLFEEEFVRVYLDLGRIYYIYNREKEALTILEKAVGLLSPESFLYTPVRELLLKIEGENDEE